MPESIPTRIERGNYTADVLQGGSAEPFWYYLIQRKNSNKVIDLVKFKTFEEAINAAREALEKLDRAIHFGELPCWSVIPTRSAHCRSTQYRRAVSVQIESVHAGVAPGWPHCDAG